MHDHEDIDANVREYTTVMFKAADKDGDGTLNRDEALVFSSYGHEPAVEAAMAKLVMRDHDKDGDGKLTTEEFQHLYTGGDEGGEIEAEDVARAQESFAHMDKNADNGLDVEEVREWESE